MSGALRIGSLATIASLASSVAGAQSILDVGARVAPQYHSYELTAPSNTKISELSVPLFVVVPVSRALSFDVGTSFSRAVVDVTTTGQREHSEVSGLTDTQVRGNYTLGNDFVVLTAGVNLPTGQSTVKGDQFTAASLIGSDFLAFPISNMGTGFGATGGAAFARPIGDFNVGLGVSVRRSSQYGAFEDDAGALAHYQPGNEYRARGGIDRAFGTGRVSLGLTYSTFGNDHLDGYVYNTGNRWVTQLGVTNTYGPGQLSLTAWNLFREAGTLYDSSYVGHENIANAALAYGVTVGPLLFEPNVEGRIWTQYGDVPASGLATFGVRAQTSVLGFTMLPSAGFSIGQVAAQDQGINTTANLTGWHVSLAIRLR